VILLLTNVIYYCVFYKNLAIANKPCDAATSFHVKK